MGPSSLLVLQEFALSAEKEECSPYTLSLLAATVWLFTLPCALEELVERELWVTKDGPWLLDG